jgi:hypothetical protein
MGKISQYQQNQLRSSLVGTPGVDTSATSALSNLSTDLKQGAHTVYTALEDDYQLQQRALQQRQTEQRADEKKLRGLYDQSVANTHKAQGGIALNQLNNNLRPQFKDDITGGLDAWSEQAQELINDRVGTVKDPTQKAMTYNALQEEFSSQSKNFSDYLNGRIPEIAKDNFNKVGDSLRLSVNNTALTGDQVFNKLKAFGDDKATQAQAQAAFGADGVVQIRKHQSAAAQNYMELIATTGDDKALDKLIHDKRFDSIIEGTDKGQFYSRQRALASAVQTRQKQDATATDIQTRAGISATYVNTDLSDPTSINGSLQQIKSVYHSELAKPKGEQSIETIHNAEEKIHQLEGRIKAIPKEARLDKKQIESDRREIETRDYNSMPGIKARARLDSLERTLIKGLNTSPDKQAALKRLNEYNTAVEQTIKQGYIDPPGSKARTVRATSLSMQAADIVKGKKDNGWLQIQNTFHDLKTQADRVFSGFTPAPGKTSAQTHDTAKSAHDDAFNGLVERYRKHFNKDPDKGTMQQMHIDALKTGGRAAYGR